MRIYRRTRVSNSALRVATLRITSSITFRGGALKYVSADRLLLDEDEDAWVDVCSASPSGFREGGGSGGEASRRSAGPMSSSFKPCELYSL
jgi:hypothetical protein